MLPTPGFHHLHLNSVDPDAAIDFYVRQFPSTSKTSWAGIPALKSPSNVLILFSQVATPPSTSPQTAIWHFGWHVVDSRKSLDVFLHPLIWIRHRCTEIVSNNGLLLRTWRRLQAPHHIHWR